MNKSYFLERVLSKRPTALDEYDYSLVPETFPVTGRITIVCKKHGSFTQKASSHAFGTGCAKCGLEKNAEARKLTTEEFIARSVERFGDKFDYSETIYRGKEVNLTVICKLHGAVTILPMVHLAATHSCWECEREMRKQPFLEEARKVHGDKYDYSRVNFVNSNDKVEIICHSHGSFWQGLYDHTAKKTGCPQCAIANDRLTLDSFIQKSKEVHGEAYDYSKVVYETNLSMVTITCKKHGDWIQRAGSHLMGNGCKKCYQESCLLTTEDFISKARKIHGDKFDYSKVIYKGGPIKVEIICPKHGSFWQAPKTHVHTGNGCWKCAESKGERAVELVLLKYGINFVREYRIKPHRFRYDFFLPDFNVYIEYHGHQHYRPVDIFGGEDAFRETQSRDAVKVKLVKATGGDLIVIAFSEAENFSVEKPLIRKLKRVYRHWYVIDGVIRVFRTSLDVYKAFGLPPETPVRHVDRTVLSSVPNSKLLFESL